MRAATNAIHAIRNDLAPILFFAELARAGDHEAGKLAIKELLIRSDAIHEDLNELANVIRGNVRPAYFGGEPAGQPGASQSR